MSAVDFILITVAVLMMVMGVWLLIRGGKVNNQVSDLPAGVQQKDGLPILPRHMREIPEDEPEEQLEASFAEETISDSVLEGSNVTLPDSLHYTSEQPQEFGQLSQQEVERYAVDEEFEDFVDKPRSGLTFTAPVASQTANVESAVATEPTVTQVVQTAKPETINPAVEQVYDEATFDTADTSLQQSSETEVTAAENKMTGDSVSNVVYDETDPNAPLHNATETLNINILLHNEYSHISGTQLLRLADVYGFKYGAMNMFHRYKETDGTGILRFSLMGLTADGVSPFDINTMPTAEYKGLVMFLSLPHPEMLQGYDTMMSLAGLIARDLDAFVVDEAGKNMTSDYRKQLKTELASRFAS